MSRWNLSHPATCGCANCRYAESMARHARNPLLTKAAEQKVRTFLEERPMSERVAQPTIVTQCGKCGHEHRHEPTAPALVCPNCQTAYTASRAPTPARSEAAGGEEPRLANVCVYCGCDLDGGSIVGSCEHVSVRERDAAWRKKWAAAIDQSGANALRAGRAEDEAVSLRQQLAAARKAITKACEIIETGDQRLLAMDGPVGEQPPELSLAEWREMYVTLDDARSGRVRNGGDASARATVLHAAREAARIVGADPDAVHVQWAGAIDAARSEPSGEVRKVEARIAVSAEEAERAVDALVGVTLPLRAPMHYMGDEATKDANLTRFKEAKGRVMQLILGTSTPAPTAQGESTGGEADRTCPCGAPLVRDGVTVKSHWIGAVCDDCEAAMFRRHTEGDHGRD